ncbi:hypothetical protein RHSIM_Rhsim13G0228900 [Rhododendron simsii]|uniref:Uncharacterized protein n=1 Tax=Rhododendron simsii TaxID=118357 RepID=A0A834FXW8_RHOSS|nr:hypothetical protein RHSIM_Rhsim13G0228900 [Rhododendron simsii]
MATTPQPSPTTSQIPPSQFVDQTQPPTTADQPQGPPSLTTKLPCNPAGAMAGTPQPSPTVSQVQPLPITDQMQTPPPVVSSKRSRSVESMAASRGRGPSRPHKDWGTGKKLEVVLDKAPQLNPYKERIWDEVKASTNVPNVYKHNCLMSVGKKWKDWKDYLKRNYYDKYETDAERVADCPDRVDPNQWRILVAFWGGQLATLAPANGGVEPDRLEVFQKTHTKKDGKPVDEASKIAIALIDERISQVPVSLQSPTYREEVFTDVLGQDTRGTYVWLGSLSKSGVGDEEHGLDANHPQQQNGDDRSRLLRAWTDEELEYKNTTTEKDNILLSLADAT